MMIEFETNSEIIAEYYAVSEPPNTHVGATRYAI